MNMDEMGPSQDRVITRVNRKQVEHFGSTDSTCRALRLPDGVLLRYTLHPSLYFFLTSENSDGHVVTRVFATDSPYDRRKIKIGEAITTMFDRPEAEPDHLQQVEVLLRTWLDFLVDDPNAQEDFKVFGLKPGPG